MSTPAEKQTRAVAGYCWAENSRGPGRCTRPPGHDGDHADYYTGRQHPTDAVGVTWPR